ncbi:NAD(P)H-dependent oxidoreductase [Dyadobacter sediminis]|uniref:NAD(P)H-dependent oxidoreductase n=1 Tax=Dyadobacter sediminis TaxID=1493691 RepID=A0A5R9K5J6_9BACT|nr:NAD(P)H-dependent oxidoreductase [Dyadobacter sediminis]
MNVLVVLAHPRSESLSHGLCKQIVKILQPFHTVTIHDLYRDSFDPILKENELLDINYFSDDILPYCHALQAADCLIIIHPNWWGAPPAILKGWIDRVIRLNVGYGFNDNGEGDPVKLLKLRYFFVFNTSNTNTEREMAVFHDPLENIWRHCIANFLGVEHFTRSMFSIVVSSTCTERQAWIDTCCQLVKDRLLIP